MANRHDEFLARGARLYGVSVDSPPQHAAMIEKLRLPFPLISDPDRRGLIEPFGAADPDDPRGIARPTVVMLAPGGDEVWRATSRDFADRVVEDEVLAVLEGLRLEPTTQPPPEVGDAVPGPNAMPAHALIPYFRGARFAAVALARRRPEVAEEADRYVALMDRYMEAVKARLRS